MAKCKKRIAILWFFCAGTLFFIVLLQTILGRYGTQANEAWGWLLPTVMPTLSLIVGVLVAETLGKVAQKKYVDRFIFRLTFGLSAVYFCVVALTILLQPFTSLPSLELMKQSNLWLGPLQGLVSASLGVFFLRGEKM